MNIFRKHKVVTVVVMVGVIGSVIGAGIIYQSEDSYDRKTVSAVVEPKEPTVKIDTKTEQKTVKEPTPINEVEPIEPTEVTPAEVVEESLIDTYEAAWPIAFNEVMNTGYKVKFGGANPDKLAEYVALDVKTNPVSEDVIRERVRKCVTYINNYDNSTHRKITQLSISLNQKSCWLN